MTNSFSPDPLPSTPPPGFEEEIDQSAQTMPPVGITPPQVLAHDAAEGHRGGAWRLLYWIIENDPRALQAVASQEDDHLAQHLLEFIALGSWAGKPFVVPPPFRSSYARMRLSTLFLPRSGMEPTRAQRVLFQAARSPQPAVRETAISILGIMHTQHALPLLVDALQDSSEGVRLQAIKALGRLEAPEAVPVLIQALSTANESTMAQIFASLAQIGKAAVPALLEMSSSRSAWMRWNCLRALRKTCDLRAVPALARALRDVDHGVAWMGAKGLVDYGPLGVEAALRSLAMSENTAWQAETATYVLSHQQDQKIRSYLEPLLTHLHSLSSTPVSTPYLAYQVLNQMLADGVLKQGSRQ
jgi:hypothetical protein